MKTIRHDVFETNSSSMHSFTISDNRTTDPAKYPVLHCNGTGEYGWSGPLVDTPEALLDYSAVAMGYLYVSEDWEVEGPGKHYDIEKFNEYKEMIENVVEYFAAKGVKLVFDHPTEDGIFIPTGYIDHQSSPWSDNDCREIADMWHDPEKLFNFVFSDSTIEIDNDNH